MEGAREGRRGRRRGSEGEGGGGIGGFRFRFGMAVRYHRYLTPHMWTVGERSPTPSGGASCGCAVGHRALCCCFHYF